MLEILKAEFGEFGGMGTKASLLLKVYSPSAIV